MTELEQKQLARKEEYRKRARARERERYAQRKAAETIEQRDARIAEQRAYYAAHRERINETRRTCADEANARRRARRAADPTPFRESTKRWAEKNRPKVAAKTKKRKTAKQHRTPPWLTPADFEAMERIYRRAAENAELTGEPYHVDHVVPLQGETVSGLHVPWNLQALVADANIRKSNRMDLARPNGA